MELYVYIITNNENKKKDLFKVGFHTGTKEKLMSRYKTYLRDDCRLVFLHRALPDDEREILYNLSSAKRGGEWVEMEEESLKEFVRNYFRYGKNENSKYYKFRNICDTIEYQLENNELELTEKYKLNVKILEEALTMEFLNTITIFNKRRIIDYYLTQQLKKGDDDNYSESGLSLSSESLNEVSVESSEEEIESEEPSISESEESSSDSVIEDWFVDPRKAKKLICTACDKKFKSQKLYDKHMEVRPCRPRICKICKKTFKDDYGLNRHNNTKEHKKMARDSRKK